MIPPPLRGHRVYSFAVSVDIGPLILVLRNIYWERLTMFTLIMMIVRIGLADIGQLKLVVGSLGLLDTYLACTRPLPDS